MFESPMLARASAALKLPTTSMWFREFPTIVRPHILPRSQRFGGRRRQRCGCCCLSPVRSAAYQVFTSR